MITFLHVQDTDYSFLLNKWGSRTKGKHCVKVIGHQGSRTKGERCVKVSDHQGKYFNVEFKNLFCTSNFSLWSKL